MAALLPALLALEGAAASVAFVQNSEPAGLVDRTEILDTGIDVATTNAPDLTLGFRFCVWTRNGVEQRDMLGRALNPLSFRLLESTTATARYLPEGEDINTNAIPDWWEWRLGTNLVADTTVDADEDGFDALEEYRRDCHPNLKDEIRDGGVSLCVGEMVLAIVDTNLASYTVGSAPEGLVAGRTGITNKGASVVLPDVYGSADGMRFVYWTVNGTIQTDSVGRALGGLSFELPGNVMAEAVFVPQDTDANTNAVPDWYELHFHSALVESSTNDADGDAYDELEEYRRDYHPGLADEIRDGGVSLCMGETVLAIVDTNLASYTVGSDPAGLVAAQAGLTNKGTRIVLPDYFGISSGLRFVCWTLDGAIQTDSVGRALGGLSFELRGNVMAQAVFADPNLDANTNAIPDWYERNFRGALIESAGADGDGDGYNELEEYRRDYHANLKDEIRDGGVSVNLSAAALAILDTNLAAYSVGSEPAGLVAARAGITNKGATLLLPDVYGLSNGWRFAYWAVNGVVQTDRLGRALGGVAVDTRGNVEAQALFVSASDDVNVNLIPDWYERHFGGGALASGTADADGDGFDLLEEYRRDYHPNLADEVRDGGVSVALSGQAWVTFGFFPRVAGCLLEGVMAGVFSLQPPGTGAVAVAGMSRPTLGDWDGDGDLDLAMGGAGGVIRIFENAGSPVVPNLTERTTNFISMAMQWSGIAFPAPALGDWNNDGVADLAIGGDTGVVKLIASTTNFLSPQESAWTGEVAVGGTSALPAFGDINGDGRQDLLVLTAGGSVSAYLNGGLASSPYRADSVISNILGTVVPGASGIASADVNGDGRPDILVSDAGGNIWEFHGDGAGHFAVKSKVFGGTFAGFAEQVAVAAGDWDGDGDTDVLCGYAQGGLVYLLNPADKLLVQPPVSTVRVGGGASFTALNPAGPVTWRFLSARSGGSLDATSGVYTAGTAGRCTDVVEGCDTNGLKGRAYVNVITDADMARAGKAIVVAGRRSADDPLWPTTDYLSRMGYGALLYRGFGRENVRFLSPVAGRDADGNGADDDIAGETTFANVGAAFTNWAAGASELFVYLVDHGGDSSGAGYFRLNASEILPAAVLDAWLDRLQNEHGCDVTVLIDCCYAGSFLDELAYPGPARRTVIAACGTNEPTYFVSGGLVSFSDAFFGGMLLGLDLPQCYGFARTSMEAYQTALIDDTGDGVCSPGSDGAASRGISVGLSLLAGRDIPQIGSVCGNLTLSGGEIAARLWAGDVVSGNPVQRVWCLIVPPGHNPDPANPVAGLPELDLHYSAALRRYEGVYGGFTQKGVYKVQYYAADIWNGKALPRQSYVTQDGFDERVVLVAGGETNDAGWSATDRIAALAWHTCRQRWIAAGSIRYLSARGDRDLDGDGTNDVAGAPGLAALADAITNWASGSDKLTVYLVGIGHNAALRLNAAESLGAAALDAWMDTYQASNRPAAAVLEFAGSGGFLSALTAPAGRERICMASSRSAQGSLAANGGLVSFSQYFLSDVFAGYDMGLAFARARDTVNTVSGTLRQAAQLDDNGDGVYTKADGAVARQRYIGSAFVTGADLPVCGRVMPAGFLAGTQTSVLWAADVTAMDGMSNVWCLVTPPDYDGSGDLPRVDLSWNAEAQRYEGVHGGFTRAGAYVCTFQAADASNRVSGPAQIELTTAVRADGVVRDQVTGEWLGGAGLAFTATSGGVSGQVFTAWPATNAGQPWTSLAGGTFPTNVWLPAANWDLRVSRNGYTAGVVTGAVANLVLALDPVVLDTVWLRPLDTNANGIADEWEAGHFPAGMGAPEDDADQDGASNREEYFCGTDPAASNSVLRVDGVAEAGADGFELSWPVSPGRRYRVVGTDTLGAEWALTDGPWTATNGQSLMRWVEAGGGGARTGRFYRVEVAPPR